MFIMFVTVHPGTRSGVLESRRPELLLRVVFWWGMVLQSYGSTVRPNRSDCDER